MGFAVNDIEKHPVILLLSLKNRIIPRYEYLRLKRLEHKYALWTILYRDDRFFAAKIAKSTPEDYQKFKQRVIIRDPSY
jgi:hypothetical protein